MITSEDAKRIASGWVSEYSSDPDTVMIERERRYFFELDDLIHHRAVDALVVFEMVAGMKLNDWTFEGFSAGPIREFLYLYGDEYHVDLDATSSRAPLFAALRMQAEEGL